MILACSPCSDVLSQSVHTYAAGCSGAQLRQHLVKFKYDLQDCSWCSVIFCTPFISTSFPLLGDLDLLSRQKPRFSMHFARSHHLNVLSQRDDFPQISRSYILLSTFNSWIIIFKKKKKRLCHLTRVFLIPSTSPGKYHRRTLTPVCAHIFLMSNL